MSLNLKIKYSPLPAQAEIFSDDTTESMLHSAGLGSGKSYNLCMKIIKLSRLNRGHAGGLLCPSYAMFKKDIYPTFQDIFESSNISSKFWRFNGQDKTYQFAWNSKPLYIFTAENEIAGPNLGYGGVNEFSLCSWDRINQFLRRIRTDAPFKQKILAGTPEDKYGWVMDYVDMMNEQEKKKPGTFKIVFGDTSENKHIDQSYVNTLEYMLDKRALDVFKKGHIVKLTGDRFYYSFDRTLHVKNDIRLIPGQTIYANMDFNVGRMTATFAHRLGASVVFFDEFELLGNSDTAQAAQEIIKRYGKNVIVTIDASGKNRKTSGASDYQILCEAGFDRNNIRFKSVNPRFRERQLLVNGKLDKGEILISDKCKVLIKDLEQVEQSRLTFEKIKDKDGKLTHSSDTLDYFIDYEFTLYLNRQSKSIQL